MAQPLDLNDPIAVLLASLQALDRAGLRAATYGGLALAAYGTPRETKDADLAIAGLDNVLVRRAFEIAELDVSLAFERVRFGGNLVSRFTLLPGANQTGLNTVDLIEPRSPRYASQVLARAIQGTMRGSAIAVVSPEDFVLLKALSTRERDLEDAASVISSLAADLDLNLIRTEAAALATEIPDHIIMSRLNRILALP